MTPKTCRTKHHKSGQQTLAAQFRGGSMRLFADYDAQTV